MGEGLGEAVGETMGDGLNKRSPLEALVAPLVPRACREEVLGDLHERNPTGDCNVFLRDALLTVPLVIASRIRRTWEPTLFAFQAVVLCFSFCAAALLEMPWFLDHPAGLFRVAIPCAAALLAMVLDDAYGDSSRTPFVRLVRSPMVAVAAALVSQGALLVFRSSLALPVVITFRGVAAGLTWMLLIRAVFPPPSRSRRGRA